jgi:hypothetical protein
MAKEETTLIEAIESANRRRKYYLNSKVKQFTKLSSLRKYISIPAGLEAQLTTKQQGYIKELIHNYGYAPQACIPD